MSGVERTIVYLMLVQPVKGIELLATYEINNKRKDSSYLVIIIFHHDTKLKTTIVRFGVQ
jgi:hypothetical protein